VGGPGGKLLYAVGAWPPQDGGRRPGASIWAPCSRMAATRMRTRSPLAWPSRVRW